MNTLNRNTILEQQMLLRQESIRELDKMIRHFSKGNLYQRRHYQLLKVEKLGKAKTGFTDLIIETVLIVIVMAIINYLIYSIFGSLNPILLFDVVIFALVAVVIVCTVIKRKKNAKEFIEAFGEFSSAEDELNKLYKGYGYCPVDKEHADPEMLAKIRDFITCGKAVTIKEAINLIDSEGRNEDLRKHIDQIADKKEGSNNSGCASFLIGFSIVMLVIGLAFYGIVIGVIKNINNYVNANKPQMVDEYNRPYVTSLEQLSEDDIDLMYEHAKEIYVSRLNNETVNSIELVNVYLSTTWRNNGNRIYIVIKPDITYSVSEGVDETYESYYFVYYPNIAVEEDGSIVCDLDNAQIYYDLYYPSEKNPFYYLPGGYDDEQSLYDVMRDADGFEIQEIMYPIEGQ